MTNSDEYQSIHISVSKYFVNKSKLESEGRVWQHGSFIYD